VTSSSQAEFVHEGTVTENKLVLERLPMYHKILFNDLKQFKLSFIDI